MKKIGAIVIGLAMVFGITVSAAQAWDFCLQDPEYATELWLSFDAGTGGLIVNGQAIYEGEGVIGAITGSIVNGPAFAIQYLGDAGLRYYTQYQGQWWTWGIYSDDSTYYDTPRPAQLGPCGATVQTPGATGAAE